MATEEATKKVEATEVSTEPEAPATPPPTAAEAPKDVAEEKEVNPSPKTPPPPAEEKADDSKALAVVEIQESLEGNSRIEKEVADPPAEKSSGGSSDRDAILARVETEKRMSLIKAWEESEKTKAENKAEKKMSSITSWENSKKAAVEAQLRKIEEQLEKKKAEYAEKMKNKIALLHKEAEEKRAMVEAKRGEEVLKAEELAAKYRATGLAPKKIFGCFGP